MALIGVLLVTENALPQEPLSWKVTLGRLQSGEVTAQGVTGNVKLGTVNLLSLSFEASIVVRCLEAVDCTRVVVSVANDSGSEAVLDGSVNAQEAAYHFSGEHLRLAAAADRSPLLVRIEHDGSMMAWALVRVTLPSASTLYVYTSSESTSISDMLLTKCPLPNRWQAYYDRSRNRARYTVSPNANVLSVPEETVDEDDIIEIVVWGDKRLVPGLQIKRKSQVRVGGDRNIRGASIGVPSQLVDEFLLSRIPDDKCAEIVAELSDFAGGSGLVGLSVNTDDGEKELGDFDFPVNPLYIGSFSLGVVVSWLSDPEFGLVYAGLDPETGADSVVTETDGGTRVLYSLFFSPFVSGKRDLEKPAERWFHRVNPSIGVVLNDIPENFLFGVSMDFWNQVFFSFGGHAGRVNRLNPEANLEVGDRFNGAGEDIPTVRKWNVDYYVGVTLDLAAAVKLFAGILNPT
jgi:hypothetical protein